MVNVEQITSRLSMMPDQALQQYAMMHKNDPYVLSLAVSESNRRKQMRAAAVPQAQEQPKVADQAVASMALPERQGIGSLPAEMNFADGGIVAFADGGDVERYQYGGTIGSLTGDIPGFIAGRGPIVPQVGQPEEERLIPRLWRELNESAVRGRRELQAARDAEGMSEYEQPSTYMAPQATSANAVYDPATATRRAAYAAEVTPPAGTRGSTAPSGIARLAGAAGVGGAPSIGGDMVSRAKKTASEIYDTSEQEKLLKEKQDLVNQQTAC